MLSKKTLDILSVILVILFVISIFLGQYLMQSTFNEIKKGFNENTFGVDSTQSSAAKIQRTVALARLPIQLFALAYYIIMLITAIQLHKKNKYSLGNTIVLAILPPFAFIFYLVSLRSAIKKYEAEKISL